MAINQDLNSLLERLVKTLEAGNYNIAPSQLTQGAALQVENLAPVMQNVTFGDQHIILQKAFKIEPCRSMHVQFNRQLSYGVFGGSAANEGQIGSYTDSDFVRAYVSMAYYSTVKSYSIAAQNTNTFDGTSAETRIAEDAARKLAGDIEFDLFKGKADFSNDGVFDGNPLAIPAIPNMLGVDPQIRQSDYMLSTHDLMFDSYGSDQSVVLNVNGALDQAKIEDASVRSQMNLGFANRLFVDPITLSAYNKAVALGAGTNSIQRIIVDGSAKEAVGASLKRQFVSNGTIELEMSRFLSGKTKPQRPQLGSPSAPSLGTVVQLTTGALEDNKTYQYIISAENERGEGYYITTSVTLAAANHGIQLPINAPSSGPAPTHYNIYRSPANGSIKDAKFIGRVKANQAGATLFYDYGNKAPGFVTGYLLQMDTWAIHELMPFSRQKLAQVDLTIPMVFFRFLTLAGYQPRKNVILDNLY